MKTFLLLIAALSLVTSQSDFFKNLLDDNVEMDMIDNIIAERDKMYEEEEDYYYDEEEEEKEKEEEEEERYLDPRAYSNNRGEARASSKGPTLQQCMKKFPGICGIEKKRPPPLTASTSGRGKSFSDVRDIWRRLKEDADAETSPRPLDPTTTTTSTTASAGGSSAKPFFDNTKRQIFSLF